MEFIKTNSIINHQLKLPSLLINSIIEEYVNDIDSRPMRVAEILNFNNDNFTKINKSVRNCEVDWIPANTWLPSMLWYHIVGINNQYYKYDIQSLENLQLTSYSEGEFYTWHVDSYHNDEVPYERKLSFSLQLTDPSEYDGGDLQLMHPGYKQFQIASKEKGVLTVFDSRMSHRVRKIKRGKRICLVGWAIGPLWK
jgi:PKHD-type hydroxylase